MTRQDSSIKLPPVSESSAALRPRRVDLAASLPPAETAVIADLNSKNWRKLCGKDCYRKNSTFVVKYL